MDAINCFCCLKWIWNSVEEPLRGITGAGVADSLTRLRDWVVEQVRSRTLFWGNQVEPVPIPSVDLVGMEEIQGYLEEIAGYLKDDSIGVIGVHGPGGVGKTTLLARINNKFPGMGAPGLFEVVIWATASKNPNTAEIQKLIGDRLGLDLSKQGEPEEQATAIFRALSGRRFLLLLDDVWEKLELKKVGIPQPDTENKCKIILTTRSKQVCASTGAKKVVKVAVLNESASWKLFRENVGDHEALLESPLINPHAKAVARKCGGLPLALITVGRAMAGAESVEEWREAVLQLSLSPQQLPGMKDEVLSLVKLSFDKLGDDHAKECLLYCCLFPEDYEIPVRTLVQLWVGEGLLDNAKSDGRLLRAQNRGYGMVTKLQSACLLEPVEHVGGEMHVKMHDVVRDMCVWITGGEYDENNNFVVPAGEEGLKNHVSTIERWRDTKIISVYDLELAKRIRSFPNLQTLAVYGRSNVSDNFLSNRLGFGFFEFMPLLRVLDLSWTKCGSLPEDIGFLTELRYLNLEGTVINSLPEGLGRLRKLSQLNLNYTRELYDIPEEVDPALTGLRALGLFCSAYNFEQLNDENRQGSLSYTLQPASIEYKKNCWKALEELQLTIRSWSSLEKLLNFDRLRRCTIALSLRNVRGTTFGVTSPSFLENLCDLRIQGCHGIHDLAWVRQLPCLRKFVLFRCNGIKQLLPTVVHVGGGGPGVDEAHGYDCSSLRMLKEMHLDYLPGLTGISTRPLLLPSLRYLSIKLCHRLKKLPFGPDSAKNIQVIEAGKALWEGLEWSHDVHGQSIKPLFLPYFRSSGY